MTQNESPAAAGSGIRSEASGQEVLKIKIEDLFREVERLRTRIKTMEESLEHSFGGRPGGQSS